MKYLLVYLKDYKKESILGPLFKLLEASFELIIPLVVASIIDIGIQNSDKRFVLERCLLMAALGLIGLICSITAQYFAAKAAVGFATKLRHALFSHIQSFSFSEMDTISSATLITRMTGDINQTQSGVNLVLRLFLRSPFIVFGSMLMAFTIDVQAALIFVVIIPILSFVVFGIILITIPFYKKVQASLDLVLGQTRENLVGARVIRAFCLEEKEATLFDKKSRNLRQLQMFVGRISGLMNPITYIIVNVGIIYLIHSGSMMVELGILSQGAVIALVNYMSQILVELIKLANLIVTITKSVASGNRIENILKMKPDLQDGIQEIEGTERLEGIQGIEGTEIIEGTEEGKTTDFIAFSHVHLRYKGAREDALTDIDFKVQKGQTIGIIGGTGSGKSSLVHLISRFYDVAQGSVQVAGEDVRNYKLSVLRSKIGIVMQKAVLFKGTIRENLLWGNENATEEELLEALRIAQAEDFVMEKEGQLNSIVEQEGRNLSGGQRQRLTIARALVRKPEILILDDSASALDYATDAKLRKAIKEMPGDTTVFIVSQRASSVLYVDQIIVLEDGITVGIGTQEELIESCEVYREIYESQYSKVVLV